MGLCGGRGGDRRERRWLPHGVLSASSARCGKARARARVSARGDGWGLPGDVGATQGGGRRAARPPRGRGRRAATPGQGPGVRSAPRGKGTWAVKNQAPRGHVRWGRGLFGERAFGGGGWLPAGGGEAAWLRLGAAFEEGAAGAPEVSPTGDCPWGRRPHGRTWTGSARQRGDPSSQFPATGSPGRPHVGREPATLCAKSRSTRAPKGTWKFEEWEKPEAWILITRKNPLPAYVSALPSHGPLELYPKTSGEVRGPTRCKWHCSLLERGKRGRLDGSPTQWC